ncbi:MAG TPA: type I DNA topoisomerase [Dehalococcoidales bacterium]|nr:type I DNA topoisomerase [Dehalococcoidales bacterium]
MSSLKKELVIVESPAKARTLGKILGSKYNLKASMGHIRDLPRSKMGVDIEHDFSPQYVVPRPKAKLVKELKDAGKEAKDIILATDPDREGEAIAWHLANVINGDSKEFRRVVFHEITEEAVKEAFKHPRTIDSGLVDAQQARRVLDRLVGYKLSPLLWQKVRRGLSAGRVQSVALRIIVDREREIEAFVPQEYWVIGVKLQKESDSPVFTAQLVSLLDGTKLEINSKEKSDAVAANLEISKYMVHGIKTRKVVRQPAPPFITSTLQQEAWYKLRFSAGQTMAIAQELYEGLPIEGESIGLITYMRTDSVHVAHSAVADTREFIQEKYGAEYVPQHARTFSNRVKGAQEAHEAIRPTRTHRTPESLKHFLNANQLKLYTLIWNRMVASQMAAAIFENTTVDIDAKPMKAHASYLLRTSASELQFPGYTVLYQRDEGKTNDEDVIGALPKLEKGNQLIYIPPVQSEQKFTQPPPRYTEASLIRALEEKGIGRPSTYAPILGNIQDREYVTKTSGIFKPTDLGTTVTDLLIKNFPDIVDIEFTAKMEDTLDEIADDKKEWVDVIRKFYSPFEKTLETAKEGLERVKLPDEITTEICEKCGKPMAVKVGRFGKFLACTGYPECKTTKRYAIKTGVKCPECGGQIIQRLSKKNKTFYGCDSYPKCTFAMSTRPLPQPCPQCGGLLTEYREGKVKCTKCKYRGTTDGKATEPAADGD